MFKVQTIINDLELELHDASAPDKLAFIRTYGFAVDADMFSLVGTINSQYDKTWGYGTSRNHEVKGFDDIPPENRKIALAAATKRSIA
ncbi:hypothetical protein AGMMS49587_12080 [Spirochaetia bacterium]|nr:hypothetical protein AGMMS49587_12080 [Spirochaetia bacterium]